MNRRVMPRLPFVLLCIATLILLALLTQFGWSDAEDGTTLRRGAGAQTETLDPHQVISNNDGVIVNDLFEGLIAAAPGGALIPGAAHRWDIFDAGLRYRFYLRADGRWSNGDPVTAGDFVTAWRRLVDPRTAAPYASFLEPVLGAAEAIAGTQSPQSLGVSAVDPLTFEVRLVQATPFFLSQLRHYATFPIHRPTLERHGARFTRAGIMVSNGAYALEKSVPGGTTTLKRNRHFHSKASVAIERVVYVPVEDPATELMMWRTGALDTTWDLQPSMLNTMRSEQPKALRIDEQLGTFFLALNLERPGLSDVRVRQALSMVIDRDTLVEDITRGGERPAWRWMPPSTPGASALSMSWSQKPLEKRRQEAIALLGNAGFGPRNPLVLEFVYDMGPVRREVAIACAEMWKKIGVRTKLINVEQRVLSSIRTERRFDVLRAGWTADYADAHSFLEIWLSGAGGLNQSRWRSARFDALVAASRTESDPVRRSGLVLEAERLLLEQTPMIPLFFFARHGLVRPNVCGWVHDPVLDPATRWLRIGQDCAKPGPQKAT
jgi:oligopeptide transport system substrate-binding protein